MALRQLYAPIYSSHQNTCVFTLHLLFAVPRSCSLEYANNPAASRTFAVYDPSPYGVLIDVNEPPVCGITLSTRQIYFRKIYPPIALCISSYINCPNLVFSSRHSTYFCLARRCRDLKLIPLLSARLRSNVILFFTSISISCS